MAAVNEKQGRRRSGKIVLSESEIPKRIVGTVVGTSMDIEFVYSGDNHSKNSRELSISNAIKIGVGKPHRELTRVMAEDATSTDICLQLSEFTVLPYICQSSWVAIETLDHTLVKYGFKEEFVSGSFA